MAESETGAQLLQSPNPAQTASRMLVCFSPTPHTHTRIHTQTRTNDNRGRNKKKNTHNYTQTVKHREQIYSIVNTKCNENKREKKQQHNDLIDAVQRDEREKTSGRVETLHRKYSCSHSQTSNLSLSHKTIVQTNRKLRQRFDKREKGESAIYLHIILRRREKKETRVETTFFPSLLKLTNTHPHKKNKVILSTEYA